MNYITSLLTAFCVSAVFIGALYMLCPDGSMSKSVRYILGICFLLSVLTAAFVTAPKAEIDFDFSAQEIDNEELLLSSARYTYSYALQKADIDYEEILIFTNKTDDRSISITKICVKTHSSQEAVLKALGQATQNIEVVVENE